MDQNTKTTSIYLGSAFVGFILIMAFAVYLRKDAGKKIQTNLGYAIGTYRYSITGGKPLRTDVYFNFEADSKKFERMPTQGTRNGYDEAIEGNKYLVIYDTTNPKNCQILFDYPIKDSSDFTKYLEEFKTKPLDFDKYF